LQNICKHENRKPLGAQWFEDCVTSEKLQNSLQKAYLPGKEVIPDFQTSQKVSKTKEKSPKYVDLGDFSCNKRSKSIFFQVCLPKVKLKRSATELVPRCVVLIKRLTRKTLWVANY